MVQALRVGQTGGTLQAIVDRRLGDPFFGIFLNPGHLLHLDEWVASPVAPGSQIELRSGTAMQFDIIPATGTPWFTSNIEDGIALADAALREELAKRDPALWRRVQARRAFMRDALGIELHEDVLPLSNIPAWLPPFLLDTGRAMTLRRRLTGRSATAPPAQWSSAISFSVSFSMGLPRMIMPRTSSVVTSALLTMPTIRPWYMTAIRSERSKTSWMSWLMRKMPRPSLFSWRMRSRTCAVSAGPSAAVGSSMMRMRALKWTARAMATAWRCPPESDTTGGVKFVKFGLRRPMTFRVASLHGAVVERAPRVSELPAQEDVAGRRDVVGERQRLVDGLDLEVLGVPRVADGRGPAVDDDLAESAGCAPESTRMSVVLPAPLPPTRPTTSPA